MSDIIRRKRSARYDYAKLFLIACVVFGHIAYTYSSVSPLVGDIQFWVYLFHMPAFLFICGCFAKRTIREARWEKIFSYLLIYLFMELLSAGYRWISSGFQTVKIDLLHEDGVPWFAMSVFLWMSLSVLLRHLPQKPILLLSVLAAVGYGYAPHATSFLSLNRTITFYCFFYLGYMTDPGQLDKQLERRSIRIGSLMLLLVTLAFSCYYGSEELWVWKNLFRGHRSYADLGVSCNPCWGGLWRLGAILLSMMLVLAILALMPQRESLLSGLGSQTLPVFVFHNVILSILFKNVLPVRQWMASGDTALKCCVVTCLLVWILCQPPFVRITDWVKRIPMERK